MHGTGEGDIRLLGSRHPCVEAQDDVNFIANDVHLVQGVCVCVCVCVCVLVGVCVCLSVCSDGRALRVLL